MNKEHEIAFIKEMKYFGIKTKDHKKLIHSFTVIEGIAFENHKDVRSIIAIYDLAETSLSRG